MAEAFGAMMFFAFLLMAFVVSMFVLWIWAFVNVLNVPHDSFYRTGTKLIWSIVVGLGGPMGAIVYLAVGEPGGFGGGR